MRKYTLRLLLMGVFLLFYSVFAAAEAPVRSDVIEVGGQAVTITATRYEAEMGYAMWLDLDFFSLPGRVYFAGAGDSFRMHGGEPQPGYDFTVRGTYPYDEEAPGFAAVADGVAAQYAGVFGTVNTLDTDGLFGGALARAYYGIENGVVLLEYVVDAGGFAFSVLVRYPQGEADGSFAARVRHALAGFEALP